MLVHKLLDLVLLIFQVGDAQVSTDVEICLLHTVNPVCWYPKHRTFRVLVLPVVGELKRNLCLTHSSKADNCYSFTPIICCKNIADLADLRNAANESWIS